MRLCIRLGQEPFSHGWALYGRLPYPVSGDLYPLSGLGFKATTVVPSGVHYCWGPILGLGMGFSGGVLVYSKGYLRQGREAWACAL